MRYMIVTYYKRPNGKIDEVMAVAKNIKPRDQQMANLILDFKTQSVVKCVIDGKALERDWDRIVSYYYEHYSATMERLFKENGHELKMPEKTGDVNVIETS